MSELQALQSDFVRSLRTKDDSAAAAWLEGDAAHAARRLAIYRTNMGAAADKALSAAYPVARQLLGADFFAALARAYQRARPSASGDLGEFGDRFADFVADFEHTRDKPWLPDLCRLEWAAHLAYGAADAPHWDPAALAAVAAEDQMRLQFAWVPGLAVIESNWPIVRLWTLHQPGYPGEFAIDWTIPERALVARAGLTVTVDTLGPGDAAFLQRSVAGATLADAAGAALQAEPAFDLGALLGRLIAGGQACGFKIETPP